MKSIIKQGLEQTYDYMDLCGTAEGHLIVFESDHSKPWEERLFRREETIKGKTIIVWGS